MLEEMVFGHPRMTGPKLKRALENQPLLLVASANGHPVGFKFGYQLPDSTTFFSWLGGVRADWRRQGIAQALLEQQEAHARNHGLTHIYFTSFDRFPEMIAMGQKNGYQLQRSAPDGAETKYWFTKTLE
jgi:predicted GNAT superfamily acetyltransferase